MIDLAAVAYVAMAFVLVGGLVALSRDRARRRLADFAMIVGIALLGAAASRWWGRSDLEAITLVVCAVLALRGERGRAPASAPAREEVG